jgi:cation:H+ antiporter
VKRLLGVLGTHHPLEGSLWAKLWPFPAVIGATLSIAWATEVAAFFISRGMALAILAFLQVSPEFAVEAVLAKNAAVDPSQLQFVTANFTGSNRLLVGAALPMIFLIGRRVLSRQGRWTGQLELEEHNAVEILALTIPSVYSFVWVIKGGLGLFDSVLLVAMFGAYLYVLAKLPPAEAEEVDLLRGVPKRVMETDSRRFQRNFSIGAFAVGGAVLFFAAEPFVHGMQEIGDFIHVPPYLLLQWVAPLLSEFPEFFTVIYWSRQGRAVQAFMNIVAAKINQWTLLIAMIPLVFAITHLVRGEGGWTIEFDYQQRIEVLLTAAQGLFAAVAMFKLRFMRWEAYALLVLWAVQLFDPLFDPALQWLPSVFGGTTPPPELEKIIVREYTTIAFFGLIVFEFVRYRREWHLFRAFGSVWRQHVRRGAGVPKPSSTRWPPTATPRSRSCTSSPCPRASPARSRSRSSRSCCGSGSPCWGSRACTRTSAPRSTCSNAGATWWWRPAPRVARRSCTTSRSRGASSATRSAPRSTCSPRRPWRETSSARSAGSGCPRFGRPCTTATRPPPSAP